MASHRFYYLLTHARHRMAKTCDRECRDELGISTVQLGALFTIGRDPGCQQRQVAEALGLNDSAVTGLLSRMARAELIERRPSPTDARAMQTRVAPAGEAIIERARPLLDRFNRTLCEGFSNEELDVVARFLRATIERF